jgi:outer membrane protein OmpA-like peptidoglycan-associated protein
MTRTALTALLLPILAATAHAQGTGTLEFGGFGQVSYFDRSIHATQGRGGPGALFGFFLSRHLELQGEAAFVPTDVRDSAHVYYIPLRARVVFNLPAGEHTALFLGGGYVHNEYRHDADASDDGATALAGIRLGIRGLPSIRVASYVDYIPSPANNVGNNVNWGLQVGLSWLFGRNAPKWSEGPTEGVRSDSAARADSAVRVDSLRLAAAREDSARAQAARDRARMAALRDSLARVALRDSLRALAAAKNTRVTLRGVNFEINKAVLLPESRDILGDVAQSLVANPEVTVEVAGHTDNTGPRALNDSLSLARAESVKAYLIEHGVQADRMTVHGYAWDQPVASNKTASGRAQNRRVELRRTD